MKQSPLQLEGPEYPLVSVRAIPGIDGARLDAHLPVSVKAGVAYEGDGDHFAFLSIEQPDESYPYVVDIQAVSIFRMDAVLCKEMYQNAFNPGTVAVNVARILYSSAREMLAFVTARGPYGAADLQSVIIEMSDLDIQFEDKAFAKILKRDFCMSAAEIKRLQERLEAALVKAKPVRKAASKGTPRKEKAITLK